MFLSSSSLAHSRCLLICHVRVNLCLSGCGRYVEPRMRNHCKAQCNTPEIDFLSRQGISSMDRITHRHLSSCSQMPKFMPIPAAKRIHSFILLSSIKCCLRTEKASHLKKVRLSSSSASWSYFEVYGDVQGHLSPLDETVCRTPYEQTLHREGTSRVLAAWKKIQSWSPTKSRIEEKIRDRPIPSQKCAARSDRAREQSATMYNRKGSGPRSSWYTPLQAEAYIGQSRNFHSSRAISQPPTKKMNTKRQLAVAAITQALTPSLHPQKRGQGELGLCMANFLKSFTSPAQTNETRFCEDRVRQSLEIMLKITDAAEREVKAIQSWINDAENHLHSLPSERDIERLEALLDNLLCHSEEGLARDKRDQFLRVASNMKYILANMHTVAEIQELQKELEAIDKEISRCNNSSKEAVSLLRSAIARGEVAWLRNLESVAACLEAMARTVLPLEGLYKTNQ
ncbi:uncharacterized protein [Physcomitrium patens]|uniref:Uncharacterized protein n=1 Tax=Physcomitrium patens TaxID=3218 RepID=A0A2K1IZW0_PHYPA|nr:uncharacterized protein LOC112295270 [Physcomitrium patens]PNR34799.1 hypothetical protein PHYPA_022697 [Physcomitrium patens]|eukprot:XP_024402369.1 uncharacterized protein LOC112295270 [Physcomitrella patens]